jgi:hypothetical protein
MSREEARKMSTVFPPTTFNAEGMRNEMTELYEPMISNLTRYSGAMWDSYTAMSSEWLTFLNRRLHTDLSHAARLAHCSNPQEYVQEWTNFLTTAATDYRHEFEKLAQITTAASQKMATSMQSNGRPQ